jgi:hypothetical protein
VRLAIAMSLKDRELRSSWYVKALVPLNLLTAATAAIALDACDRADRSQRVFSPEVRAWRCPRRPRDCRLDRFAYGAVYAHSARTDDWELAVVAFHSISKPNFVSPTTPVLPVMVFAKTVISG